MGLPRREADREADARRPGQLCAVTHLQCGTKGVSHGCGAPYVNLEPFHGLTFGDRVQMNEGHCSAGPLM